MEYQWTPPKYKVGQLVTFKGHERLGRAPILVGRVNRITTGYMKDGAAYHNYTIRPENRRNDLHVGEENIFWTL